MSPEQIESAKVSGQADQYSLAVIAYQMLSGKRPFDAETGPSLMFQIMSAEAPALHTVNPAIPPGASEVIAKAMAKKPEDRYASCREFAERLSESLSRAQGVRQAEVVAAAPAVRTAGSGVPAPERAREERPESASGAGIPTRRSRLGLWIAAGLAAVGLAGTAWMWGHRPTGPALPPVLPPEAAKVDPDKNIDQNADKGADQRVGPAVAPKEAVKPARQAGATRVNAKDGLTYVWIPPGTFQMGCSVEDTECEDNEKPAHRVTITRGFWIGQTEVTQEAWKKVMGTNPSYVNGAKLPVENVGWEEAKTYCGVAGMRLPTEAEWEYAARAGSSGSRYGDLAVIAWFHGNSGVAPHEVGQKPANRFGLHDMLGNVGEWVADWFANQYPPGNATDPKGPATGTFRTLRGGSFFHGPRFTRASSRMGFLPTGHRTIDGVRCAGN
jgi:formylglycine-generating enzyme required for sulfatase activity